MLDMSHNDVPEVAAPRSTKAETLRRVGLLKKRLAVAALVGFGAFGGLAAGHHVGTAASGTTAVTSANTSTGSTTAGTSGGSSTGSPSQGASGDSPTGSSQQTPGSGFFDQGQGGYGFGSGGSNQAPMAGSGAS